jgi:YVTN family beta-propeller protein
LKHATSRTALLTVLALVSIARLAASTDQPSGKVVATYGGPDGGYDYVSVDPELGRVFIAREYGVMAIDLATRRVIDKLVAANDVAAVLPIPGGALMLSTSYVDDAVLLFDRRNGKIVAKVSAGDGPDAATYDPSSHLVFVMNGNSEDLTLIDPARRVRLATIPAGGRPEAAVADGRGRVFVNIEDKAHVAEVDTATRKVTRRFALPGSVEPTGIDFDAVANLLLVACHNSKTKLIHAATGKDRGSVPTGSMADGAIFDAARRVAYVSAADGTLTRFELDARGKLGRIAHIATAKGARTAALDPRTGQLYLPTVDTVTEHGKKKAVPGSFRVLEVAPSP